MTSYVSTNSTRSYERWSETGGDRSYAPDATVNADHDPHTWGTDPREREREILLLYRKKVPIIITLSAHS